jgi:hypothetical protein
MKAMTVEDYRRQHITETRERLAKEGITVQLSDNEIYYNHGFALRELIRARTPR